jgi:uncharacterized membrane protein
MVCCTVSIACGLLRAFYAREAFHYISAALFFLAGGLFAMSAILKLTVLLFGGAQ